MGAKAKAGHPWEFVRETVDLEAGGQLRRKGAAEVPTFATWAKDWTSGALAKKHPDHVRGQAHGRPRRRAAQALHPAAPRGHRRRRLHARARRVRDGQPSRRPLRGHPPARRSGHGAPDETRRLPGQVAQGQPDPFRLAPPRRRRRRPRSASTPTRTRLLLGGKSVQTTTGAASGRTSRSCAGSPTAFSRARACAPTRWSRLRWRDVDLGAWPRDAGREQDRRPAGLGPAP